MIYIVLMEPENAGNVGAVARLMQNFGLSKLVLVNPKCNHLSSEAIARSKHAKNILENARLVRKLAGFDACIATTARIGTDYNVPRSPLTPEQLACVLPQKGKIALLFGREGQGLHNDEIRRCDFVVHIPSNETHPTLNLSHAVGIVLYEVTKTGFTERLSKGFAPASTKEKELLLKRLDDLLDSMSFPTETKKETQRRVWRRLIGKSFLTKREAMALFGFFRKLKP